nr:replication protein A 70 kDa DNA-binding subunit D-like [Ipomoea batatas]
MPYFRKDFVEPVIVLIQMGRVKVYENSAEVKITSSYDATQLLFNGDSTEFLEFRDSLSLQQTPLKSITSNSAYSYGNSSGGDLSSSKMRIITISDIFQNREGFFSKRKSRESNMICGKLSVHVTETEAVREVLLDQFSHSNLQRKKVVVGQGEKGADYKET